MIRREFLTLLGGVAAGWPRTACGADDGGRRVGVLMLYPENDPEAQVRSAAFEQALEHLGWAIGRNVQIDYIWGEGDNEWVRAAAAELLRRAPDVILANGSLLKEIAPHARRVGFIFNPDAAPNVGFFHAAESAAEPLAIGLAAIAVRDANDIEQDVTAFASEPDGGLIVAPHAVTLGNRKLIIELAARYPLPAVYSDRYFAESGGLVSFGNNTADLFRRAASYIDLILKGAKPAELPVQLPTKFELIVNLKTAKSLGFTIPESFLSRADEVIE